MKAATTDTADDAPSHEFQSTPPVKAATGMPPKKSSVIKISIHAAREGGDGSTKVTFSFRQISIHAAREGGDTKEQIAEPFYGISIHAAREGGDVLRNCPRVQPLYFNPRRP